MLFADSQANYKQSQQPCWRPKQQRFWCNTLFATNFPLGLSASVILQMCSLCAHYGVCNGEQDYTHPQLAPRLVHARAVHPSGSCHSAQSHQAQSVEPCLFSWWLSVENSRAAHKTNDQSQNGASDRFFFSLKANNHKVMTDKSHLTQFHFQRTSTHTAKFTKPSKINLKKIN